MHSKVTVFSAIPSLKKTIEDSFEAFGGIQAIVKGNIYIKVNLTMADPSAITSPEVVLTIIEILADHGIDKKRVFVFDNAAVGMATRVNFQTLNFAKRIEKIGANVLCLDEQEAMDFDFEGKVLDKPIKFPKILYDELIVNKGQNTYINVPRLKIHPQTKVTICIKNQHGLLYDPDKLYNHHHMNEKMVEVYAKIRPDFNIVDGLVAINHNTFAFKEEWAIPMNLIIAGTDGVAVDTVCAELIDQNPVEMILLAGKAGLGEYRLENIEILPNRDVISQNQQHFNSDLSKVPVTIPDNVKVITGSEWKGCTCGCQAAIYYLQMLTSSAKCGNVVTIIGRGFNTKEIDSLKGPFLVCGPCAVNDLRPYFQQRIDKKEKISVAFIEDHFDIGGFIKAAMKVAKVPFAAMRPLIRIPMSQLMKGMIGAKRKHANFIGMI